VSEGETPTPSSLSPVDVESLINECNDLHLENARLRDLVCWLRGTLEGMKPLYTPEPTHTQLTIFENHADFFARKEMEDAWDIVIQQNAGESNGE